VQDRENVHEITRLHLQDQMLTTSMGGALPEQPDPTRFQSVLDVGCGTGNWLITTAKTYPTIRRLVGVDISTKMLDFAREQARTEGVSDRVEFAAMDALRMLEFPESTFDLVNHRLGMGWLRKWDWPNILQKYFHVCKIGGVIRLTEGNLGQSSSQASRHLAQLLLEAFYNAGNLFENTSEGVISQLPSLLSRYVQHSQTRRHEIVYRAGTPEWKQFYEDARLAYRTILPFLQKWTHVPDNYDDVYQQMLTEMQQPGSVATWTFLTVWGVSAKQGTSQRRD